MCLMWLSWESKVGGACLVLTPLLQDSTKQNIIQDVILCMPRKGEILALFGGVLLGSFDAF